MQSTKIWSRKFDFLIDFLHDEDVSNHFDIALHIRMFEQPEWKQCHANRSFFYQLLHSVDNVKCEVLHERIGISKTKTDK